MNLFGLLKGDSRSAKVRKNIVGSFFVKGLSISVSLTLVPLTIGYISSELYGIWLTLSTLISWAYIFDLGFGNGLRNKLAASIALNDWEKARRYVSTAYVYFSAVFIPIGVIIYFGCPYVDWCKILNINVEYQNLLISVMRIIIVFFCGSMVLKIQSTVLQALQKNALASALEAFGQLLVLIVTYILTCTTEPSLIYLAYAISASPIVIYIIASFWLYGYKYKQLRPSISLIDKTLVKDILNLGLKFFVIQIAGLVLYQTINIIISNVAGAESVTEYNVVYKYISIPFMATSVIVAPFWSAFTDAYTVKDLAWMKNSYKKLLRIIGLMALTVIVMTIVSPWVFKLWLGDKVIIHTQMVIIVMAYVLIMIWNSLHSALINGTGLIRVSLFCALFCAVMNIPLALFLGHRMGAEGVILSVALLNFLTAGFAYVQINKIINNKADGIWNK